MDIVSILRQMYFKAMDTERFYSREAYGSSSGGTLSTSTEGPQDDVPV